MLKADFHVHTSYSKCADMRPRNIVKQAISKGYNVLGVVDHGTTRGATLTKKIAGRKLLIIPGEEIRTDKGEVIVFLSDGKYNKNLMDICERARDMNHFIMTPHPFDYFRSSLKENISEIKNYIGAVEVFNSRVMVSRFNDIAKDFAKKNKIPMIAGTDSHFLDEIGNTTVYLDCKKDVYSVLKHIKKKRLRYRGKNSSPLVHFRSLVTKRF